MVLVKVENSFLCYKSNFNKLSSKYFTFEHLYKYVVALDPKVKCFSHNYMLKC